MITKYHPYGNRRHYLKPDEFLAPFDAMLTDFFNHTGMSKSIPNEFFAKGKYPKCNVIEHNGSIEIQAGVPGLTKDDIKIELTEDTLSISLIKVNKNKSSGTYIKKELKETSWRRSFFLNDTLDTNTISATVENGLLSISIQKLVSNKEVSPVKVIEIN